VRPKLKSAVWYREGEDLYVVCSDQETQITLADPDGHVEALLGLLREGTRGEGGLTAALAARPQPPGKTDVLEAIAALDEIGLLTDADEPVTLSAAESERFASNVAFFTTFASLDQSAASFQRALLDAHVVFLGTGGLGSSAIQALSGAGVGRMTLLDSDVVETRNFARQYLYREADIGQPKVDRAAAWVRAFHGAAEVRPVSRWITDPGDIADLLADADFVVDGVDQGADIDVWVNEACVAAGVPYVRGGFAARQALYFSVDPGRSACLMCRRIAQQAARSERGPLDELLSRRERVNRGIGPVASMVGALVAMEALRYLTGFAPPIAAGCVRCLDLATGEEEALYWQRMPDCPACKDVVPAGRAPAARLSHG
jgi:molybdopterin-synthase adenylyltransferase